MKLFADDSSLFLRVRDVGMCHQTLKSDLKTISKWAYQWKMKFNPDISKQAVEVIFSHKRNKPLHPALSFNDIPVKRVMETQHIGLVLDEKLNFRSHISEKAKIANKGLGLLKFLAKYTTRKRLSLMYKIYVRPHLDYGDVVYHNQSSESMDLLSSIQYNAALIVAGCWKGTSKEKIYNELGWETLNDRRHFRRLTLYYKIKNNLTPDYLRLLAQPFSLDHTNRFLNSFFPYCHHNWKNLDLTIKNSQSLDIFKKKFIKTIRPIYRDCFDIRDRRGISLLSKLRLDFSDLREHRFRHKFNCPSPDCRCGNDVESTTHFLVHCDLYRNPRQVFMQKLLNIIPDYTLFSDNVLATILIFGHKSYSHDTNKNVLTETINFINKTKRFKTLEAFTVN